MHSFSDQVQRVKDRLRASIFRAEIPEGAMIHEDQVRRETTASVRAVRRALMDLAREGLLYRKRHVGTFVGKNLPSAVCAVLPRIRSIGILSGLNQSDFGSSRFIQSLMTGIDSALQSPGQISLFVNTGSARTSVMDTPIIDPDAVRASVQGIISIEANKAAVLNDLVRAGISLTAIDYYQPRASFDVVAVDHQDAGFISTAHLLALGHRRIAFVGEAMNPLSSDPTWQDRLTGYLRAMAGAGGETPTEWILNIRRDVGRTERELPAFHRAHQPSAYVLCTGHAAIFVQKALRGLGLECPKDVSLTACDTSLYNLDGRPLSQVRVDYEMVGRTAVRILASRLACRAMPAVRVNIAVDFNPGETSRAPETKQL